MSQIDASITFCAGSNLKAGDLGVSSDPFLVARIGGLFYMTQVVPRTRNPVWNESWEIQNVTLNSNLDIEVWDKDSFLPNDLLGKVKVPITSSELDGQQAWSFEVKQANGHSIGSLTLKIATRLSLSVIQFPTSNKRAIKIHNSNVAGTVTGSYHSALSNLPTYRAYSMDMYHVGAVFLNKYQKWNENYKAAKMIFGNNPASKVLRQTIRSQHTALYREGYHRTERRFIGHSEDFFAAFDFGMFQGVRREYTYVLLDDRFNFSETGAAFFTDFMSKHAMHSKAAKEVRYSGEFRVFELPNGRHRLVIDNGSGTYAPNKDDLPLLKEAFKANFEDMDVEVYDFRDPALSVYKQKPQPPSPQTPKPHTHLKDFVNKFHRGSTPS